MAVQDRIKRARQKESQEESQKAGAKGGGASGAKRGMPKERRGGGQARQAALQHRKAAGKKEHFLRARMWVGYLVSLVEKDRGKIPSNIGNRMLITNNLVITKNGMSSIVHVETLSLETPQCLLSRIIENLREHQSGAVIDFILKNEEFVVQFNESGLKSRIYSWEKALQSEEISDGEKEVAARCLYTVGVAREGARLMRTRLYLIVRAKTGSELTRAEKIVCAYLTSIHATYAPVAGNLKEVLQYIFMASNKHFKEVKDFVAITTSEATLAQMLPNSGSLNDHKGLCLGTNIENYSQYLVDFESITAARNLYCIAPSGGGKTVVALNLCCSAIESGWAVCIQDIKGNEFSAFVKGTGGYIVSMRQMSSGYINSFAMRVEEVGDDGAEMYFKERFAFSKKQLMILSGITGEEQLADLEELLDGFLNAVYVGLGVIPANRATWKETLQLNPFRVYDMLLEYLTPEMQKKYASIARKLFAEFRMYLSKDGSKSYVFTEEFNYMDILYSDSLMFDFGILDGAGQDVDRTLFRLKFEYMRMLNASFIAYKYKCGKKVLKVLEEAQIAVQDPEIMKGYVEEYTLRRAQGQTTLLLGNSITALVENATAKPLIENVKAILMGAMNAEAKEVAIKAFGLEEEAEWLEKLSSNSKYGNAFLFINRMQADPVTPILKVLLKPQEKYKLLTPEVTM